MPNPVYTKNNYHFFYFFNGKKSFRQVNIEEYYFFLKFKVPLDEKTVVMAPSSI